MYTHNGVNGEVFIAKSAMSSETYNLAITDLLFHENHVFVHIRMIFNPSKSKQQKSTKNIYNFQNHVKRFVKINNQASVSFCGQLRHKLIIHVFKKTFT